MEDSSQAGEAAVTDALGCADIRDLARALDPRSFVISDGHFSCPYCGRPAVVIDGFRWRCDGQHPPRTGTVLGLRQLVAADAEAAARLVALVADKPPDPPRRLRAVPREPA